MPDAFGQPTEEERMQMALAQGRMSAAPGMTVGMQAPTRTPDQLAAMNKDFSGEARKIQGQRDRAQAMRGAPRAQGKEVGPLGVYMGPNIGELLSDAANQFGGAYLSKKADERDVEMDADRSAAGLEKAAYAQQKEDYERNIAAEKDQYMRLRDTAGDIERSGRYGVEDALSQAAAAERKERYGVEDTADARDAKEYVEFGDSVGDGDPIRGYTEGGVAFTEAGEPMPEGYEEKVKLTRASGSSYSSVTETDAFGNTVVTKFDKGTGEYGAPTFVDGKPYDEESARARGAKRAGQAGSETTAKEKGKTNVDEAVKAGEKIGTMNKVLEQVNKARTALSEGANTGPIAGRLPGLTMKASTTKLENARDKMALFDIGNYTFGSLSEAEGDWLKTSNIPMKLEEDELDAYLQKRAEGLERAITAEEYVEEMRRAGMEPDRDVINEIKYSGGFTFGED